MGRFALDNAHKLEAFKKGWFPNHRVRFCGKDEDPFLFPRDREFPAYVSYVTEGGLRFPLDPLLVAFLEYTRTTLGALGINAVRIILSIAELNRRYGLELGIPEIFYCYSLQDVSEGYILESRSNAPSLIMCLPRNVEGRREDIFAITEGPITDPPCNLRIVGGSAYFPPQTSLRDIKVDQLNAICGHDGLQAENSIHHPRASHLLLGYTTPTINFLQRVSTNHWVGKPPSDPNKKYLLFKRYKVLNKWVDYYEGRLQTLATGRGDIASEARATIRKAQALETPARVVAPGRHGVPLPRNSEVRVAIPAASRGGSPRRFWTTQ